MQVVGQGNVELGYAQDLFPGAGDQQLPPAGTCAPEPGQLCLGRLRKVIVPPDSTLLGIEQFGDGKKACGTRRVRLSGTGNG